MKKSIPVDEMRAAIKAMEFPFCYYGYIIDPDGDVDHLHFGLWKDGTSGIKQAQENLSSLLLAQIPDGISNILDIGCGLGTAAYQLASRGYRVVGISPDEKMMDLARSRYAETDRFRLLTVAFEKFDSQEKFDLMLLQESSQYINVDLLFLRAKQLLGIRGYVLMCDEVRYPGNDLSYGHPRSEILAAAERHGFRLLKSCDITPGIMETRHFGRTQLKERRAEILRAFVGSGRNVEDELTALEQGWASHDVQYEAGGAGYEWFLFRVKSSMREIFREWLRL